MKGSSELERFVASVKDLQLGFHITVGELNSVCSLERIVPDSPSFFAITQFKDGSASFSLYQFPHRVSCEPMLGENARTKLRETVRDSSRDSLRTIKLRIRSYSKPFSTRGILVAGSSCPEFINCCLRTRWVGQTDRFKGAWSIMISDNGVKDTSSTLAQCLSVDGTEKSLDSGRSSGSHANRGRSNCRVLRVYGVTETTEKEGIEGDAQRYR
mmetsp:Transcript_25932/g.36150  ORF Transcript_25932/g.36150 Transcript_25932/m.36150 type:complete len:213 (-) Transcript_25932:72-710(-)